jgi:hypothetical protein
MTTPEKRQLNIDKIFDDFITNGSEFESLDEMIEEIDEVIFKAILEKFGHTNSSQAQKKLVRQKMNEYMMNMDFNTPSLAYAEKLLHAIGAADFSKAAEYLERLHVHRSNIFSKAQSVAGNADKKRDSFAQLLFTMVSRRRDISTDDVIEQLESVVYSDVICHFDEEEICYLLPNGLEKCVKKTNIPARLARLRKKFK